MSNNWLPLPLDKIISNLLLFMNRNASTDSSKKVDDSALLVIDERVRNNYIYNILNTKGVRMNMVNRQLTKINEALLAQDFQIRNAAKVVIEIISDDDIKTLDN